MGDSKHSNSTQFPVFTTIQYCGEIISGLIHFNVISEYYVVPERGTVGMLSAS